VVVEVPLSSVPFITLSRDITWGDHVFTVGTQVRGEVGSRYFSGVYRFAAYRNDRFEIGPAVGFGHLPVDAYIAPGSLWGGFWIAVRQVRTVGEQGSGHRDPGGYVYWWPIKQLLIRGDMRYIVVKPEKAEASITDGRAAAVYHPWRKVGIGLPHTYTNAQVSGFDY
jgi:hypothetical protein